MCYLTVVTVVLLSNRVCDAVGDGLENFFFLLKDEEVTSRHFVHARGSRDGDGGGVGVSLDARACLNWSWWVAWRTVIRTTVATHTHTLVDCLSIFLDLNQLWGSIGRTREDSLI